MKITGIVVPFLQPNTDTDVIIPARFLKRTALDGFEPFAFFEKRYLPSTVCEPSLASRDYVFTRRDPDPESPFNHPAAAGATFLLTWNNFGCGSSREHAVYALRNYRVIIGGAPAGKTAFADIFRDNCRQNLIWTPVLSEADHGRLAAWASEAMAKGPARLTLDSETARLSTGDGALDLPCSIPPHHVSYIHAGKDPFETAKEQVASHGKRIDAWFREHPAFYESAPDALAKAREG
ncbi:MAG: 3-isopropylmalate dehydratase small subunit [Spirochaetes bacterium]|nr:3-isopropylmalate dehydratase small subunit [Spirochaetota bacterium]